MLKSTLTQWQIFNSVIDNGGYLRASAKLNRSHSSLHHAIHKLQTQLGVELIYVEGKQLKLTAVGEVMRRRSLQLLADAEELEELASFAQQGWEPELTIALESMFPKTILTTVLEQFHTKGKGTRLKIDSVILNGAVEAIHAASADLVITPIAPKGHLGTPLTTVRMLPLAHRDHPLVTANAPVDTRELSRFLQIVISDGTDEEKHTEFGWLKSEQRWTVSDFHHARDILISGMGFCWLPENLFTEEIRTGLLRPINGREGLERYVTLHLVVPRPERLGPAGQMLAQLFRSSRSL
ncbi:MAG: LysR family transcriptional regulator [Sneathiella sp.]|nr:MAG: LysR family transcriptional regulator [Sneathiella sp.]